MSKVNTFDLIEAGQRYRSHVFQLVDGGPIGERRDRPPDEAALRAGMQRVPAGGGYAQAIQAVTEVLDSAGYDQLVNSVRTAAITQTASLDDFDFILEPTWLEGVKTFLERARRCLSDNGGPPSARAGAFGVDGFVLHSAMEARSPEIEIAGGIRVPPLFEEAIPVELNQLLSSSARHERPRMVRFLDGIMALSSKAELTDPMSGRLRIAVFVDRTELDEIKDRVLMSFIELARESNFQVTLTDTSGGSA